MYMANGRLIGSSELGMTPGPGRRSGTAPRASGRQERVGQVAGRVTGVRRLAVLPFVNVTDAPVIDAVCHAITERVSDALGLLVRGVVLVPTGRWATGGGDLHLGELGRRFDADGLLVGHLCCTPGGLWVRAELLEACSGARLWADRYYAEHEPAARSRGDLVADLAYAVAASLRLRLRRA